MKNKKKQETQETEVMKNSIWQRKITDIEFEKLLNTLSYFELEETENILDEFYAREKLKIQKMRVLYLRNCGSKLFSDDETNLFIGK